AAIMLLWPARACLQIAAALAPRRSTEELIMHRTLRLAGLAVAAVAALGMFHPHVNRTEVLELENVGKIELSLVPVPFNPKHLENLEKGYLYHLGFAGLKLPCELKAGDVTVPAGDHTLAARYSGDGQWALVLFPRGLSREVAGLSFAMLDGKESTRAMARKQLGGQAKKLKVSAEPIVLPTTTSEHEDPVEHLAIHMQVANAKGPIVAGFSLWAEFGPLKATVLLALPATKPG